MTDPREALRELDTPEAVARFLVLLEYDDAAVLKVLREQFPGNGHERVLEDAKEQRSRSKAQLEQALDDEAVRQEYR